jgi:branched-chain amino acid transport system substrate-binding protein
LGVAQIRVTPKTRNPFTIKALSISGVTWEWHFLNHAPQLFLMTGADKWGNYQQFPWTIGWQPSYRTEALILPL